MNDDTQAAAGRLRRLTARLAAHRERAEALVEELSALAGLLGPAGLALLGPPLCGTRCRAALLVPGGFGLAVFARGAGGGRAGASHFVPFRDCDPAVRVALTPFAETALRELLAAAGGPPPGG